MFLLLVFLGWWNLRKIKKISTSERTEWNLPGPTRTLKACLPCAHHIRLLQTLFFAEVLKQELKLTREKKDPPICWFLGARVMYGRNMIHWGFWITLKKQHLNIFKGEQEAYPPSHWNEKPVAFTCIKIFVPSTSLCAFTASCFNLDLKPPREKPWTEGILGDSFPNHLGEFPTGGLVDMTCPGLILWSQLPECNVKIKGSTNEHRQNPSWKRWDSSKTSQTHVWNPTFSPRNGPKSLNHSFLCHVCIFGHVFRNYSKSLLKRWFLELSPLPLLEPPFRVSPTTRHQQEEGHNTCPPKPDFLGMAKGDTKEAFFEKGNHDVTEFLDVLGRILTEMR